LVYEGDGHAADGDGDGDGDGDLDTTDRTSPAANTPGTLVSRRSGSQVSVHCVAACACPVST
jgi:hypothetical protein